MNGKELKKGDFIKWTARRMFKSWDCYGIVISKSIAKDEVKILTYDDFKETSLSLNGDAVKHEMELCNAKDIRDYLNIEISKVNAEKVEEKIEFNNKIILLDEKISKSRGILKQLNKK
jgi:hypothetical protein